ncbi:MAG: hypothetical protein JW818_05480 [Pirellulales bacterium]|nr:hypothetical protein [Pirellulales bacterium]
MIARVSSPRRWILLLGVVCLAAGCSDGRPTRVPVAGQVLIDGQPLTRGYIRFVPEGARASGGQIGPDGRFVLTCYDGSDGAVPGAHRIEVTANEVVNSTTCRWHAPKKYANFNTSDLSARIEEPTDALTIHLTWSGGTPFLERTGSESKLQ